MLPGLLDQLGRAQVFDLSQPYYVGMPHHPNHPPFLYGLSKTHGTYVRDGGVSAAAESISLGGHVGTHIDALCHFSKDGMIHGGIEVAPVQSDTSGISVHGVDTIPPIVRRGVLIDVAKHKGAEILDEDFAIDARLIEQICEAQETEIRSGDVVLVRTGWANLWRDSASYMNDLAAPGPDLEAGQMLSEIGIFAGGSDTIAFELMPNPKMEIHGHFLVEKGIHIIEALNMEGLSAAGVTEFAFVGAPIKIENGTGAPIRPLALV